MMTNEYPPSAFYFEVSFTPKGGSPDTAFQEVSGISSELDTEEVVEGGENRFVHQLPKGVKHPKLVVKRGIAELESPLVKWCQSILENFTTPIVPKQIVVSLFQTQKKEDSPRPSFRFKDLKNAVSGIDAKIPIRTWNFANAYPVNWEVEDFNSTKNDIAIEKIDFVYSYSSRVL